MYKYLYILSFFCLSQFCIGQQASHFPLSLSYLSANFNYPGVKLGTNINIKNWQKTNINIDRKSIKHRTLVLAPQIGFYTHKQNHTGVLLNMQIGVLRQKENSKWFHQWSLGVGAALQINSGTTYIVQSDDSLKPTSYAGRVYFHPSFNYEIAYIFNSNIAGFLKTGLGAKLPYNTFFTFLPFAEVGFKLNLKSNE